MTSKSIRRATEEDISVLTQVRNDAHAKKIAHGARSRRYLSEVVYEWSIFKCRIPMEFNEVYHEARPT